MNRKDPIYVNGKRVKGGVEYALPGGIFLRATKDGVILTVIDRAKVVNVHCDPEEINTIVNAFRAAAAFVDECRRA